MRKEQQQLFATMRETLAHVQHEKSFVSIAFANGIDGITRQQDEEVGEYRDGLTQFILLGIKILSTDLRIIESVNN
jgi:hypothetical protein